VSYKFKEEDTYIYEEEDTYECVQDRGVEAPDPPPRLMGLGFRL
jgi:hypothetical protein